MGQRLVITIRRNEKDICKMYYHWSAYSTSALMEAKKVLNEICINDYNSDDDLMLGMIRFCERNGGGIDGGSGSPEWDYIANKFPNENFEDEFINRNYGLIAISENGMKEMQGWSEGDIIIDLDDKTIWNTVLLGNEDIESYNAHMKEWYENWENIELDDIIEINCDPCDINFGDLDYLIESFNKADNFLVKYKNEIFELIA